MTSCKAPWSHIWVETTGRIKPCCVFGGFPYKKHTSIQEAFDSEENKIIRSRMQSTKILNECKGCTIYDDFEKYDLSEPAIRSLEISFDNNCNFKCVTCESKFSYLWHDEDKELLDMGFDRTIFKKFKNNIKIDLDFSKLEKLRFAGGEPVMSKRAFELLDSLSNPEKVELQFNTNNSIFPKNWIPILKKMKRVILIFSIDGVHEVGEFVRYGYKQTRQDKNFKRWLDVVTKYKNIFININYVSHGLNSLDYHNTENHIEKTLGYSKEWMRQNYGSSLEGKPIQQISIDNLYKPFYLNTAIFPDETKKIISKNIHEKKILNHLNTKSFDLGMCKQFIEYCNFLENRMPLPRDCEIIYESVANVLRRSI